MQRLKALATQSNSGSVDATARGFINTEYQGLLGEITATVTATTFNGAALIDGSYNQNFQVGIAAAATIVTNLTTVNANVVNLGLTAANGSNANAVATVALAVASSGELDTAINNISTHRANIGALISRFEYRGDVVDTQTDNLDSARSAIMDVDLAGEQTRLTSFRVLTESSIAALAQANQMKSSLLSLVR